MTVVAGIDLGGHVIHMGIVDGEQVKAAYHIKLENKSHSPANLLLVLKELINIIDQHNVEHINCEKPLIVPDAGFPALDMVEMFTLVKLASLQISEDALTVIVPSTWRKRVLGNGHANKKDAIEFVKSRGWISKDHNEMESIAIGFMSYN